jgi:hypothetical protein
MRALISGFLGMALMASPALSAVISTSALHVEKMAVGTAIDGHTLEGAAETFDATIPQLYCWTRVTTEATPATLKHVWYLDGKQVANISLPIKYASVRTWSSKTPSPGAWKVEAVDAAGTVLSSVSFTVTASTSTP